MFLVDDAAGLRANAFEENDSDKEPCIFISTPPEADGESFDLEGTAIKIGKKTNTSKHIKNYMYMSLRTKKEETNLFI